jgi:hypothetical protein
MASAGLQELTGYSACGNICIRNGKITSGSLYDHVPVRQEFTVLIEKNVCRYY